MKFFNFIWVWCESRKIDNIEAAFFPHDLVSTKVRIARDMAGHTRNCPISKPSPMLAARMAMFLTVIGCELCFYSLLVETKAVR